MASRRGLVNNRTHQECSYRQARKRVFLATRGLERERNPRGSANGGPLKLALVWSPAVHATSVTWLPSNKEVRLPIPYLRMI